MVGGKCQSVKLIKLIILIEIDYRNKIGIKGHPYSLLCRISSVFSREDEWNSIKLRRSVFSLVPDFAADFAAGWPGGAMEFDQIETFLAVLTYGGFYKTAEALRGGQ